MELVVQQSIQSMKMLNCKQIFLAAKIKITKSSAIQKQKTTKETSTFRFLCLIISKLKGRHRSKNKKIRRQKEKREIAWLNRRISKLFRKSLNLMIISLKILKWFRLRRKFRKRTILKTHKKVHNNIKLRVTILQVNLKNQ